MVEIIGIETEHPYMDKFDDKSLQVMCDMVSTMNKSLYVSSVNYNTGRINVGVHHNVGTADAFDDNDYLSINVGAESIGCMFYEVAKCLSKHL